jgi:hypothetical protein
MNDEEPRFRIEFHPEKTYPRIDDDGMYVSGPAPTITGTILVFFGGFFVLGLLAKVLTWLAGLVL